MYSSADTNCISATSVFLKKFKNTPRSIFLKKTFFLIVFCSFMSGYQMLSAQSVAKDTISKVVAPTILNSATAKKWYDKINLRGYVQVRYNRLLETNPKLKCEQCDKSWGENGGFFLRRLRLVFSGNLGGYVSFYIQPDFASAPSSSTLNFGQIRDTYFDVSFDKKKEYRIRFGQSKVPFGLQAEYNVGEGPEYDPLTNTVLSKRLKEGYVQSMYMMKLNN